METRDIHRYEQQIESILESVKRDGTIKRRDKETIIEAYEYMRAVGLSHGRIAHYLHCLRNIARMGLKNTLKRLDSEDVMNIARKTACYSHHTKMEYRKTLFLLSRIARKNIPPLPVSRNTRFMIPRFLTIDQIRTIIGHLEGEYRLLAWFLWDSGARVGEAFNLRACDVLPDKQGARIVLSGKTGKRVIRLLECHTEISRKALLLGPRDPLFSVSYDQFRKVLSRTGEQLGIRITPYTFRHSRATFLAQYLTEFQMCAFFGWRYGSRTPSIYVHLSSRDIEKALSCVPCVVV